MYAPVYTDEQGQTWEDFVRVSRVLCCSKCKLDCCFMIFCMQCMLINISVTIAFVCMCM